MCDLTYGIGWNWALSLHYKGVGVVGQMITDYRGGEGLQKESNYNNVIYEWSLITCELILESRH
jgi:hypothetical protein